MTKIGLEIHCQLTKLESKLLCSCKADYRGFEPNSNICPVCIGLPGSLPRLNQSAVSKATTITMALNCKIPPKISFFRKNYFYPDLPKNFQITQLDVYGPTSIGHDGYVSIEDDKIHIRRIQIEEDPGRIIYEGSSERTKIPLIDYNRAGTPLVEIVTDPDFKSPKQVRLFLHILSDLLENLEISDPTLEGAIRADANVSIEGGKKVEIKNISSFHDLEKAIHFELIRQQSLADRSIPIIQETRHWDDRRKITISSRSKEKEQDYRYFLEGDIPRIVFTPETMAKLQDELPESISSKKERYIQKYNIAPQVAEVLSTDKFYSDLFEHAHNDSNAKDIANIITTDLMGLVDTREKRIASKLTPQHLTDLIELINGEQLSRNSAKIALQEIVATGKPLGEIISSLDLGNVSDESKLSDMVDEVLKEESKAVEDARKNPETINYLVGKVMKKTKGKADPTITLNIIKEKINS